MKQKVKKTNFKSGKVWFLNTNNFNEIYSRKPKNIKCDGVLKVTELDYKNKTIEFVNV